MRRSGNQPSTRASARLARLRNREATISQSQSSGPAGHASRSPPPLRRRVRANCDPELRALHRIASEPDEAGATAAAQGAAPTAANVDEGLMVAGETPECENEDVSDELYDLMCLALS